MSLPEALFWLASIGMPVVGFAWLLWPRLRARSETMTPGEPMATDAVVEYEQASEDWRHRDSLTWQLPAVLVAVSTLVVGMTYPPKDPESKTVLVLAAALGGVLCVALAQNLKLQHRGRQIIERIHKTERFGFFMLGSLLLLMLSLGIWLFLIVLCVCGLWGS